MPAPRKVDYERIEPGWRAGIKSPQQLATEYLAETGVSVSHQAISKHFKKLGVPRDLAPKVHAKADAMVLAGMVAGMVAGETKRADVAIIDGAAQVEADVRIEHRKDIRRARAIASRLLCELEQACDPQVWEDIHAALRARLVDSEDGVELIDPGANKALLEAIWKASSFGKRISGLKTMCEAMRNLIALERKAYGLDEKAPAGEDSGRTMTDIERAARIASILDRARRARDQALQ